MAYRSQVEFFVNKDGEEVFSHTKFIFQGENGEYYWSTIDGRGNSLCPAERDQLPKTAFNVTEISAPYSEEFSRAPEPLPSNIHVRWADLLLHGSGEVNVADNLLREARICEVFKHYPHPNLATYHGCCVKGDRIHGLCFDRYPMKLNQRLRRKDASLDKELLFQGIENGLKHLHKYGYAHNNIKAENIMVDQNDCAIITDFTLCGPPGEDLGPALGGEKQSRLSKFETDFDALDEIWEHMFGHGRSASQG